jgi:drug/metabolite transporter (DMT)-like permease
MTTAAARPGLALRSSLALAAASAAWGLGAVATKGLLAEVPPLHMLVAQLTGSVAFLWAAVLVTRSRVPGGGTALRAGLSGLADPGLAYTVGLIGLSLTTASSATLIGATETPMIVVLAFLFLRERAGWRTLLLAAVAGVGVGLLLLPDLQGLGGGSPLGDGLMVASTLLAAVYVALSRRLVAGTEPLPLATLQQTAGLAWAVVSLAVGRAAGWVAPADGLTARGLLLSALVGLFQYALAFWLYLYGLRRVPASRAALFLSLIPVFGVGGAAALLGERLSAAQWIGGVVVLATVQVLVRTGDAAEAAPEAGG